MDTPNILLIEGKRNVWVNCYTEPTIGTVSNVNALLFLMARTECVLGWRGNLQPNIFMTGAITTGIRTVPKWCHDYC